MKKYFELLSNAAEQIARKAAQDSAIIVDLKNIERILSIAEGKIKTIDRAE